MGLPLINDGKPVRAQASNGTTMIPQGTKNVEIAMGQRSVIQVKDGLLCRRAQGGDIGVLRRMNPPCSF
jgi:hypothetical protein